MNVSHPLAQEFEDNKQALPPVRYTIVFRDGSSVTGIPRRSQPDTFVVEYEGRFERFSFEDILSAERIA